MSREPETELVKIRGDAPAVGDRPVLIGPTVSVVIEKPCDFLLLHDVDGVVENGEPERLVEPLCDSSDLDRLLLNENTLDREDRAVPVPGRDAKPAVREPGQAAHLGCEAGRIDRYGVKSGVKRFGGRLRRGTEGPGRFGPAVFYDTDRCL